MMPTVANKTVTLASGKGKVDFGFSPDYVEILNTTNLGTTSSASGLMLTAKGKPDYGSSSGKMIGFRIVGASNSGLNHFDVGNTVSHFAGHAVSSNDYFGLDIDFSSTSGVGSTDVLLVTGYRTNA